MNQPTDQDGTRCRCRPLELDFDQLAGQIRASAIQKRMPLDASKAVAHTLKHLREELPDLDDQQLARVLLTASVLMAELVETTKKWKAAGIANVLALTGERLWRAPQRPPADLPPATDNPESPDL